ncbi:hypothetical protein BDZ90DRAFT_6100 [Jaminaea rosea]|uniref:Uncharacterized protein n=1 Tax=Jaminaea rosea TaxID=1569628 RepID=A0A316UXX9_9BASI|nr:hypothetical protein BDZ90DRAFT_6100 [Jaminaea rosea]PWN30160.1 hypothetical protein BDZ90DRAFT_6100 [Jaminaea rosea]
MPANPFARSHTNLAQDHTQRRGTPDDGADKPRVSLSLSRAMGVGRKSLDVRRDPLPDVVVDDNDDGSPVEGNGSGNSPRRRNLLGKWSSTAPTSYKTLKHNASMSSTIASRSPSKGSSSSAVRDDMSEATSSHRRRKSRGLLDALFPSGSKQPQPPSSFEVLRVSKGSRPSTSPQENPLAYFPNQPQLPSPEAGPSGQPTIPGPNEAYREQRRRTASMSPPTGRKTNPLEAMTRRMSGLPLGSKPTSPVVAGSSDSTRPGLEQGGSFTLRSMHNVRTGKSPTSGQDQLASSYFPLVSSGQAPESALAVSPVTPDSPSADTPPAAEATSPALSVYEDPMTVYEGGASGTAPTSPSLGASRRIYENASVAGSSISVAKFRAARNRSESGNFSEAGMIRPSSPAFLASGLENGGMSPAERLAALEAELALGGRATPLIRQIQERHQSFSEAVSPTGDESDVRPPVVPEKDHISTRRHQARQSLQASPRLDNPPLSPQHRQKQKRFSEKWDRSPFAWFTDEAGKPPAAAEPSSAGQILTPSTAATAGSSTSPSLRGRGMDSASFLASFGATSPGDKPRTLIDALSQMEGAQVANKDEILPPSKPWLRNGVRGTGDAATSAQPTSESDGSSTDTAFLPGQPSPLLPAGSTFEAGIMAQAARSGSNRVRRPSEGVLQAMDSSAGSRSKRQAEVVPDPSAADVLLRLASTPEPALQAEAVVEPQGSEGGQTLGLERHAAGVAPRIAPDFISEQQLELELHPSASAPTAAPASGYFDLPPPQPRSKADDRFSAASIGTPILPLVQSSLVVVNASPVSSPGDTPPVVASSQPSGRIAPTQVAVSSDPSQVTESATPLVPAPAFSQPPKASAAPLSLPKPISTRGASHEEARHLPRRAASVDHKLASSHRKASSDDQANSGPSRESASPSKGESRAPVRASTYTAPRRRKSSATASQHPHAPPPPTQNKSAELLTFHAKQAQAIARAQSITGAPTTVSLAWPESRGGAPPPGIHPEYFALLSPAQRDEMHNQHQRATMAGRAAYQRAYDEAMAPLLASLPRLAHAPPIPQTLHPPLPTGTNSMLQPPSAPSAPFPTAGSSSSTHTSPRKSPVSLIPSAKFMSAPEEGATHAGSLPAIDYSASTSGLAAGAASGTLTDDLKRRNVARGAEPGEYSVTKRELD